MKNTLNNVLLQTLQELIDGITNDIESSDKVFGLYTTRLVKLLGMLSTFPGFQDLLEPLFDVIVLAIYEEMGKDEYGDPVDRPSSLESGYSVLNELITAGSRIPSLYQKIQELINNPEIYGLDGINDPIGKGLFQENSNSDGVLKNTLVRLASAMMNTRHVPNVNSKNKMNNQSIKPTREKIIKIRTEVLWKAAIGALMHGNIEQFYKNIEKFFDIVKLHLGGTPEYFYHRFDELDDLFFQYDFLYDFFIGKIKSFKDKKERACSLFEVSRIHFVQHRDVSFVFSTLDGTEEYLTHGDHPELIGACITLILSEEESQGKEQKLQKGIDILGKINPESVGGSLTLIKAGKNCEKYGYNNLAKGAYDRAIRNTDKIKYRDQVFEVILEAQRAKKDLEGLRVTLVQMEDEIGKGPKDDLGEHQYTRITILTGREYGRNGDIGAIQKLAKKIEDTHSYPEDHVRDMLLGSIEGSIYSEKFDQLDSLISLVPGRQQGAAINKIVYTLISQGKLDLALEWIERRSNAVDVNIISDGSSDLISRVMEGADSRGDQEMIRKCLALFLDFPINEWVIKNIIKVYRRSPDLFSNEYLVRLSQHCITSYQSWVKSSYLLEVIAFLKEINVRYDSVNNQIQTTGKGTMELLN